MPKTVTIDWQFVTFVADMRRQQRAFFDPKNAHRKESLLKSCKTIERQVDAYLERIQADAKAIHEYEARFHAYN